MTRPLVLRAALLLASLPLAAGCVGNVPDDALDGLDSSLERVDESLERMNESLSAMNESEERSRRASANASAASNATSTSAPPPPPPPRRVTVPVSWDGSFPAEAIACNPMGLPGCTGVGSTGGAEASFDPEAEGTVVTAHLEMAWEASSDFTRTLRLSLSTCVEDACDATTVEGPSPLVLDYVGDATRGNPRVLVSRVPNDAGLEAGPEQAFHVEGSLVVEQTGAP